MRRHVLTLILLSLIGLTPVQAQDWPHWGGPQRNFHAPDTEGVKLTATWGEAGPARLWEQPLGIGLSAIVGTEGRLFTQYGAEDNDGGKTEGVIALDADTGDVLWRFHYPIQLHHSQPREFHQGPTSTPAVTQNRVVAIGFTGLMHGLDAESGALRWSYDLIEDFGGKPLRFGHAPSPLLFEDRGKDQVIVLVGGTEVGLVAFRPSDGVVTWRSESLFASYASPIHIRVGDEDQIVVVSAEEMLGVAVQSGRIRWRVPCRNGFANNASDPIFVGHTSVGDAKLWVTSQAGYGAKVFDLLRTDQGIHPRPAWSDAEIHLHYWNALRIQDTVYASIGLEGTDFAAIDVGSGEVLWRQSDLIEKGRAIYADGKLLVLDETGKLLLIQPSRDRLNVLAESQVFSASVRTAPTLVGTRLYLRNAIQVIALELSAEALEDADRRH